MSTRLSRLLRQCSEWVGDETWPSPRPVAVPPAATHLYGDYLGWLAARGVGNKTFYSGARTFLARFPQPQLWASLPLPERLALSSHVQPFLNFLMLHGYLRPGYDFLLERKFHKILSEAAVSPIGSELARFADGARTVGYARADAMASQVALRMLIQTGRPLDRLTTDDFTEFWAAVERARSKSCGKSLGRIR